MIFLQLAVLLICIFIGSRMSGIGLGVMGMIGLLILLFVFHMQPADPPLEVMLIILSVVTAAAALQAAGGMDYLVNVAAKILRSHPGQITILGPLVTYFFTLFAGTAHISYSIMPIIAEVATKARVRPERALSMSVTAAHMAITASPVSAATAALLTVLAASGVKLADILLVCIPSTLIGVIVGILFVLKRGKELDKDPEFLEKMKDPVFAKSIDGDQQNTAIVLKPGAIKSVIIFGLAVLGVVLLGSFPSLITPVFRKRRIYSQFCGECFRAGTDTFHDHDDYAGCCRTDYSFCKYHSFSGNQGKLVRFCRTGYHCCIRSSMDEWHIYGAQLCAD